MISDSFIKPGPAQVCVGPRGHGKVVATTGHSGTTQALSSTAAPWAQLEALTAQRELHTGEAPWAARPCGLGWPASAFNKTNLQQLRVRVQR